MTETTNPNLETATLAGGCYWGMQKQFKTLPGVISSRVGFMGGDGSIFGPEPTREEYLQVKKGNTGHAEVLEIVYDKTQTSYWDVLAKFFKIHDPRTLNEQGVDKGTQYRSEIFTHSPEQEQLAKLAIQAAEASGRWKPDADEAKAGIPEKFSTKISPASAFYPAYAEHQNYMDTNAYGEDCHVPRFDWVLPSQEEAQQRAGASQSFVDRIRKPERSLEFAL
jgi:peptide-methionine (S)-S-oxide reductase